MISHDIVRHPVNPLRFHVRIPQRNPDPSLQKYYNNDSGPSKVCDTPEPSYKRHCYDNRRHNNVSNTAEQKQSDSYEDGEFYPSSPASTSFITEQENDSGQSQYNEAEKTEQENNHAQFQYKEGDKLPDNVCRECFKVFSSVKAVHGHMRTHADRGYRGMNPPETGTLSPAKPLPSINWSARQKRGRKGSKPHHPRPPRANSVKKTAVDISQYQIIHNLQSQLDTGNSDVAAAISLMMMSELETNSSVYRKKKATSGDVEITCNEGIMRAIVIPSKELPSPPSSSGEKVKMKMKVEEENKAGVVGKVFKCITCNKTFSSHQALGGHRASHNKVKASSEGGEMLEETEQAVVHHHSSLAVTEHRCRLCGDAFPTGQALGGHMRKHLQVTEARGTRMSGPSSLPSLPLPLLPLPPGSGRERGLLLSFNLNNPPSLEDMEE